MAATPFTFTAQGQNGTAATGLYGTFHVEIRGSFHGSVGLERSSNGTDWVPVAFNAQGVPNSYNQPITFTASEFEAGAQWRFVCTRLVSGSVVTRLSQ